MTDGPSSGSVRLTLTIAPTAALPSDEPSMVKVNGVVEIELSIVAISSLMLVKAAPETGTPFVQLSGSLHSPLPARPVQVVEVGVTTGIICSPLNVRPCYPSPRDVGV